MPSFKHRYRQQKRCSFHPPPLFWDRLTKLWLTKSALKEVDRQNKPLSPSQDFLSNDYTFAPDFLRNCSATCLQEIRRLSRCGGPDLSDIRNCPAPAHFGQYSMDPTKSGLEQPTTTHTRTRTGCTTVYDEHFESHLTNHDGTAPSKPENVAEIRRRLLAPRSSIALLETTLEKDYEEFIGFNNDAVNEQEVITNIFPILEGNQKTRSQAGEPAIRKQLDRKIKPSNHSHCPVVPNFFFEAKGHYGSLPAATRQACYDGALGARGMHSLQQLRGSSESKYDNKAYVITVTYYSGYLGVYVTHPTRSRSTDNPDKHTNYVMTQVGQWALHDDPETYQRGLNAYRNGRDLAKEYRDNFIRQANGRYTSVQGYTAISDASRETS
ncbi:hypothetical protein BDW67DRAFT_178638 [Aspergillus spinulosporus]